METQSRFSSILRLPPGHTTPPVLEEVPTQSPECQISATTLENVYLVDLVSLDQCGVRECQEQGETWLCLLVRSDLFMILKELFCIPTTT